MHAAQGSLFVVERNVRLRNRRLQSVCLELMLTEGTGKEAARILAPLDVNYECALFNFVSVKIIYVTSLSRLPQFANPSADAGHGLGGSPAQSCVQLLVTQQPADVINPRVARALEILQRQIHSTIRVVELPHALACGPLRLELRKPDA